VLPLADTAALVALVLRSAASPQAPEAR